MKTRWMSRCGAICGLTCVAMLAMASPSSAEAAPPPKTIQSPELSTRLGELLHNLDQDQSRRLSRASKTVGRFRTTTLGQAAELLARHPDQALVIFAKRRRPGQTRLDLENALLLTADSGSVVLSASARARSSYTYSSPLDAAWNPLLAAVGSGPAVAVTRSLGLDALAKSKLAAFVFLLKTDGTGQRTVQKLILVPDTIRISLGSEGSAGPAFNDSSAEAFSNDEQPYYEEADIQQPPEDQLPEPEVPDPIEPAPEE